MFSSTLWRTSEWNRLSKKNKMYCRMGTWFNSLVVDWNLRLQSRAGRYDQKQWSQYFFFISVDIDNYLDKFQIFIYFKFKSRFLLLSESCWIQTVNCGFKQLFMIRTWQTLHIFKFFTSHVSFYMVKSVIIMTVWVLLKLTSGLP